jgi:hypothetical protein
MDDKAQDSFKGRQLGLNLAMTCPYSRRSLSLLLPSLKALPQRSASRKLSISPVVVLSSCSVFELVQSRFTLFRIETRFLHTAQQSHQSISNIPWRLWNPA